MSRNSKVAQVRMRQKRESKPVAKALFRALTPYSGSEKKDARKVTGRGRMGDPRGNGKLR